MELTNVLPEFAKELEELMLAANRPELAAQIPELEIERRCSCEDDFCASFYTQYEPRSRPWRGNVTFELQPSEGMILLDVVHGHIAQVEVLYRDDVRRTLRAAFP